MADYYPSISRAIDALENKKSKEARRAVYDRARTTLADQLQKVDPPLSETNLEHEQLALEDAIRKVEVDAVISEVTWPIPDRLGQSNDLKSGSNSQQTQPADDTRKQLEDYFTSMEARSAQPDAKQQRERRFTFWMLLVISALWIGHLIYEPLTFSTWFDWLRLGGAIVFPILTIVSYFVMRSFFGN